MVDKSQQAIATARRQAWRAGYRQTIRHYERLHESEPDSPEWVLVLCDLYAHVGDYDKAFERIGLANKPPGAGMAAAPGGFCSTCSDAVVRRSRFIRGSRSRRSHRCVRRCERLALTWMAGRGELAQQLAAAHAERLRRTGVTNEERDDALDLFVLWVLMAIQEEEWDEAAQRCQAAVETDIAAQRFERLRIECMIEAADAAFHRRETRQAIALWEAVRQADPFDEIATTNSAIGMLRLGIAYVETDSPERAIPLWEEVRRGKSLDGYAAFNLALLSVRLGVRLKRRNILQHCILRGMCRRKWKSKVRPNSRSLARGKVM